MASKRNPIINSATARALTESSIEAARDMVAGRIGDAEILLDQLQVSGHTPTIHTQIHTGQNKLDSLIRVAVASWRRRFMRNRVKRDWCAHIGIYRHRGNGESHYDCLFCRSSISTLGHGTVGKLAPAFVDKLSAHADRCALIWIAAGADQDRFVELARTERGLRNAAFASGAYNEAARNYTIIREPE